MRHTAVLPVALLVLFRAGPSAAQQREYVEALHAARDRHYDRALATLRALTSTHPDFGRAYARLVSIGYEGGQAATIKTELEMLATAGRNPRAHYGLAMANLQDKNLDAAEQQFIAAIEEAPEFLSSYSELAALAHRRGRAPAAFSLFERLAREERGRGAPQFGLGYLHMLREEYPRALDRLSRAASARPESLEIGDAIYYVFYLQNDYSHALDVAQRMLRQAEETQDIEWKGRLTGRMGMIHLDLGDLSAAAGELEQAVDVASDLGSRGEQIFRGNLGAVYARQARYADALTQYRQALRLAREARDRPNEGRHLGLIAAIYAETADYSRAADVFAQSIEIAREVKDSGSEATQLARLSLLYEAFSERPKALETIERALAIVRQLKNPWLEGRFLEIQGLIYAKLGRLRDALDTHHRGLAVARQAGSKYFEAAALWRIGDACAALGRRAEAREHYELALAAAGRIGARTTVAAALSGIGRLQLAAGDAAGSLQSYRRALAIGDEIGSPEIVWRAHIGIAAALPASPADALSHYRAAIEAVEQVRSHLILGEERAGFLEDKLTVYRDMVRLLMQLHGREPSAGHEVEAFRIAERGHARSLLDLLSESQGLSGRGVDPALLARQRDVEASLARVQSRLLDEQSKPRPDTSAVAKLDAELSAVAEEHASVLRRIRESSAAEAGTAAPEPFTLPQTRNLLAADTVLLEYSLGERASFLFVVSARGHTVRRLPPAGAIADRVRKLRQAIAEPSRLSFSNYMLQARLLYNDLLGPAAAVVSRYRNWIVVPDGALHYLPFEALIEPGSPDPAGDPARLPYAVRKHSISYAHSASVLAELQRRRGAATEHKSLVAFADAATVTGGAATARSATTATAARLPRLPHTRREVEAIATLYPSHRLFLGEEASEEHAKTSGNLDASVLQFAVHGLLNEERPQFSGLALSQPRRRSDEASVERSEDGLLQVYEILNLRLKSDLVILSACESALGRERQGEGLTGLTQAFLHAGAASVVASLWKVDDRSTADFMTAFHRRLASSTKAEALRQARLDLIGKGGSFSHPYYWAPFVLVGLPH